VQTLRFPLSRLFQFLQWLVSLCINIIVASVSSVKKNNKKRCRWWTKFAIIESLYNNTSGVNWITLSPRLYQTCADWGRFTGCVVFSLFIISSFSSNRTFEQLSIWKRIFKENQRNASHTADTVEDCLTIKNKKKNFSIWHSHGFTRTSIRNVNFNERTS